jgi:hypothetical protein
MLNALRAAEGVAVVDVSAAEVAAIVPPTAGPLRADPVRYLAISRQLGSPHVAEIAAQSNGDLPFWSLNVSVQSANGSSSRGTSVARDGGGNPQATPDAIGTMFAQNVIERARQRASSSDATGDANAVLLDGTRSEEERLQALSRLQAARLDSAALAAAADLGTRAASARTRERVWALLRRSAYEPTLTHSLTYALLSDPDATVRKEVALALGAYVGEGGVAAALEHAAGNDNSADVRLAARVAALSYDERQAFKRETLLDKTLTPAERMAPALLDQMSGAMWSMLLSRRSSNVTEEARAYAEIAGATDDVALKARALSFLQNELMFLLPDRSGLDGEIVEVLLESMEVDDSNVRLSALSMLTPQAANPQVRAVLENVLEEDPELAEQAGVAEALERARGSRGL